MKRVLDVRRGIFGGKKPFVIRFVVGEDELGGAFTIEVINGQSPRRRADRLVTRKMHLGFGASFAAP